MTRPKERSAAYSLQVAVNERFKSLVSLTIVEKPTKGTPTPYVILGEPEFTNSLDTKTSRGQEFRVKIRIYDDASNSDAVKTTVDSFIQSLSQTKLVLENDFLVGYYRKDGIVPELINNEVWRTTASFVFGIFQTS